MSIENCRPYEEEVRAVWSQVLERAADERHARSVAVFPEDPTLRSRSFRYVRDQDTGWREDFVACRARDVP